MNHRRFLVGTLFGLAALTLLLLLQHLGSPDISDYVAGVMFFAGIVLYILLRRSQKGRH